MTGLYQVIEIAEDVANRLRTLLILGVNIQQRIALQGGVGRRKGVKECESFRAAVEISTRVMIVGLTARQKNVIGTVVPVV